MLAIRLAALRVLAIAALLLTASLLLSRPPFGPAIVATLPQRATGSVSSSITHPSNGEGNGTEENYTVEKIFYGFGWMNGSAPGTRRLIALLNLTEGYARTYPGNGSFRAMSQDFILFSIPSAADGPADGRPLEIRFSYYVQASCYQLNETTCPIGSNSTEIRQDVFTFGIPRILEYRDVTGNGSYEPGEPVAREVNLAQPAAPFIRLWPFAKNGSRMDLPYLWNVSSESTNLTMGALFAGDRLLMDLSHFWISVGNGVPVNLTLDSFLFLHPTRFKGIPLTPSQLKLDINLGVPSYVQDGTAPAVELRLTSDHFRFSANSTSTNESVYTSSTAAAAFFTWSANATVDGDRRAPVGSTLAAANATSETVYLAYPRGTVIRHDPVLGLAFGVAMPSTPAGGSPPGGGPQAAGAWLWTVAAASAGLAIGLVAFEILRRRGPRE